MVNALLRLRPDDVMLGVLPFFHTFGYTITLWTVLAMGLGAVFTRIRWRAGSSAA